MNLVVISDLHIVGPADPLYESLLTLMSQELQSSQDHLVLAGDIFDLLVGGGDFFKKKYSRFFETVKDLTQKGIRIVYIEGNHDFHLKRAFKQIAGFQVEPKGISFDIDQRKIRIEHGDLADKSDYKYRLLRGAFRSPPARIATRLIPAEWVESIGNQSSQLSKNRRVKVPTKNLDEMRRVYRNYAVELIQKGNDIVVLGHCHDHDEMTFIWKDRLGQYINVGYPRDHGTYLKWDSAQKLMTRKKLPPSKIK